MTSADNLFELVVHGLFIAVVITGYGAVFALIDVYTGRLWPSIIAHMVINGIGVLTYLLT